MRSVDPRPCGQPIPSAERASLFAQCGHLGDLQLVLRVVHEGAKFGVRAPRVASADVTPMYACA